MRACVKAGGGLRGLPRPPEGPAGAKREGRARLPVVLSEEARCRRRPSRLPPCTLPSSEEKRAENGKAWRRRRRRQRRTDLGGKLWGCVLLFADFALPVTVVTSFCVPCACVKSAGWLLHEEETDGEGERGKRCRATRCSGPGYGE